MVSENKNSYHQNSRNYGAPKIIIKIVMEKCKKFCFITHAVMCPKDTD